MKHLRLPFASVHLQLLDWEGEPIRNCVASGFIRCESEQHFLYTCWHVVTGYDQFDLKIGIELPNRRSVRIALQDAPETQPGVRVIGGLQSIDVPLYEESMGRLLPRWYQDDRHWPNPDLNAIGIFVPFWHDVVKIPLPSTLKLASIQVVDENRICKRKLGVGDKCLIVGFPFGYSAFGIQQPTPVVLTRFAASDRVVGRLQQILLDGVCAPGMSGGPVFVEEEGTVLLAGAYAGAIYPDGPRQPGSRFTDLGTVAELTLLFAGEELVLRPSLAGDT